MALEVFGTKFRPLKKPSDWVPSLIQDQLPLPALSHGAEYSQFVVRNIARLNWLYSGPLCFVAKMVQKIAKIHPSEQPRPNLTR